MVGSKAYSTSRTRRHNKGKSSSKVRGGAEGKEAQDHLFSGWRRWCARLALMIVVPALFIALLESTLLLFGFGHSDALFVETDKEDILTTNKWFVWFYQRHRNCRPHPCLISAARPKDTIRVFVLGESAAMGTPDPAFGFARILEFMLQQYFPGYRVEMVNAAMRAINSHVIVSISRQCADLEPDLFVVYMGNNETVGLYGPETFLSRHPDLVPVLHRIKQTRACQLLRIGVKHGLSVFKDEEDIQTMEFFRQHRIAPGDTRREAVYQNYQNNLRQICNNAIQSGAAAIVLTVPVNLRDCPPLGSLHRDGLTNQDLLRWESLYRDAIEHEKRQNYTEAVKCYLNAAAIDDRYAELHFRLAGCCLTMGEREAAKDHFSLARDLDTLQFRTDSRLNDIVRAVTAEYADRKVYLVDAEEALAVCERCRDGILGGELFSDHAHLRFNGDYELAKAVLPTAISALRRERGLVPSQSACTPSRDQCAKRLAFTEWDEVNTAAAVVQMTARPPFTDQLDHAVRQSRAEEQIAQAMSRVDDKFIDEVIRAYQESINAYPDDWHLRYNLATFLNQLQRYPEAVKHFQYVVDTFPDIPAYRILLGYALAQSGYLDQAIEHFRQALKCDAGCKPAKEALTWALRQK